MMEQIDEHLRTIVLEAIEQARKEQLDEEDVFWMSCGALLSEGRRQAIIGEELSYEMAAAIQTLVKKIICSN
jgi:hypothetical protein